jgi:hypothetical protein
MISSPQAGPRFSPPPTRTTRRRATFSLWPAAATAREDHQHLLHPRQSVRAGSAAYAASKGGLKLLAQGMWQIIVNGQIINVDGGVSSNC